MKNLNNAFPDTPEYVRSAIHLGLGRARRRRALKRRLFAVASVAAVLAVMLGAFSLAVNGRRWMGRYPRTTNPGPLAQGYATVGPTPKPMPKPTPQPTATPMPTPTPRATEQPTPMPAVLVTMLPTSMPAAAADAPIQAAALRPTPISEASLASEAVEAERMVYSTKGGKFYHSDWSCSGMLGASPRGIAEAEKLGQAACPICMAEEPTVWTTRAGAYYHDAENCSGMRYSVSMPEAEAMESGRRLCPVCQASRVRALPADFYSTVGGVYYHADPGCSGMLGAVKRSAEELKKLGQKPCPICVKDS